MYIHVLKGYMYACISACFYLSLGIAFARDYEHLSDALHYSHEWKERREILSIPASLALLCVQGYLQCRSGYRSEVLFDLPQ